MERRKRILSRRTALKSLGLFGAGALASPAEDCAGDEAAPSSNPALERLPVLLETDVLIVGGGPAGVCAAIAAARAGADVAMIERWPILGGLATMGHVCMWHTSDRQREVIFGLTREFMGQAAGTAAAMSLITGVRPADVDPAQLQKRLIAAGVLIDLKRAEQAGKE